MQIKNIRGSSASPHKYLNEHKGKDHRKDSESQDLFYLDQGIAERDCCLKHDNPIFNGMEQIEKKWKSWPSLS